MNRFLSTLASLALLLTRVGSAAAEPAVGEASPLTAADALRGGTNKGK